MRTILAWLAGVCFVVGVGLVAYSGYLYATQQRGPVVQVLDADREMTLEANKNQIVVFEVVNTGRKPIRAVGLTGTCGRGGCLTPKTEPPFDLPPGKTQIECELRVGPPGPIDAKAFLFVDDFGLQTHILRVHGQIISPPDSEKTSDETPR